MSARRTPRTLPSIIFENRPLYKLLSLYFHFYRCKYRCLCICMCAYTCILSDGCFILTYIYIRAHNIVMHATIVIGRRRPGVDGGGLGWSIGSPVRNAINTAPLERTSYLKIISARATEDES